LEPGEAAAAYKARILSYQAGTDFLALQAAAPAKLASLIDASQRKSLGGAPRHRSGRFRSLSLTLRMTSSSAAIGSG
jgi:hypothetical protein